MTLPLEYAAPQTRSSRFNWPGLLGRLGPLIGLVFVFVLFTVLSNVVPDASPFATRANMQRLLRQTRGVGTADLAMPHIIVRGGIGLSVGSKVALSTIVLARVLNACTGQNGLVPALGGVAAAAPAGLRIGLLIPGLRHS